MMLLNIVIIVFMILETSNILMLYFTPGTRRGNGMGAFKAFEKSKNDPEIHRMVRYLVNWLAGTKLIFIALLLVILVRGDQTIKTCAVIALALSVATFFWRLYPIIRDMDGKDEIAPRGYSRTLALMIFGFLGVFAAAILISFFSR